MRKGRIIGVLLLCLALAGAMACNPFGGDKEEASQQLVEVARGDLTISVSGSGNIEVANEAKLVFGVGGRVAKVNVEEGDRVTKGQVLVSLDTISLERAVKTAEQGVKTAEIAIRTAEIDLELATNDYRKITYPYTYSTWVFDVPAAIVATADAQRQLTEAQEALEIGLSFEQYWEVWRQLKKAQDNLVEVQSRLTRGQGPDIFETGIIPIADYWTLRAAELKVKKAQIALDKAKNDLDKAKNDLDKANDELEKAVILAPFDGVVASVYVEEGDTVSTSSQVLHLLDLTSMELKVEVDEIDIPGVEPGQRAIISVDALPSLKLEGRVTFVSPLAKKEAGVVLYEVKIGFAVPQGSGLMAGMSAEADIVINERNNVLLVPSRAITEDSQGNPVVMVVVNEQTEERRVVVGVSDGFDTEIVNGLSEGEVVVIERRAK